MDSFTIDVNFDFTTDTPGFWDNFWKNRDGLGLGSSDPDSKSKILRIYHKILWSKRLPNGEYMDLQLGSMSKNYLYWKNFVFASDSIITEFRYRQQKKIILELQNNIKNYNEYQERITRKSYTIGGMIIFPKHKNSINQIRGTNLQIRDRIDLTIECIRRYYNNEESPITWCLNQDKSFFDLFIDFKGYIDYFFLQDIVSDDYTSVKFFLGNGEFDWHPLPKNVDDYLIWYKKSEEFIDARNKRIEESLQKQVYT